MGLLPKSGKSAHRQIQGQRSKEYFQRLGESRCGVVRQKWAECCEQERRFRCATGEYSAREIRDQEARPQIEQYLNQQHGAEVAPAKDGENRCQKSWVTRQARERRYYLPPIRESVDAMLQPVHGNVGIEPRI